MEMCVQECSKVMRELCHAVKYGLGVSNKGPIEFVTHTVDR